MAYKNHKQYRLPYYNYASTNRYFVTICSHERKCLFGEIVKGKMVLSNNGDHVFDSWNMIPSVTSYADIDGFVIMPNHFHGIILINNPDEPKDLESKEFTVQQKSLSSVVRNFKSAVTTKIRKSHNDQSIKVWQPRFFDRIIRNERELNAIRKYITDNPLAWDVEKGNSDNLLM
jgi:REP element-mobilizing transposase RayT